MLKVSFILGPELYRLTLFVVLFFNLEGKVFVSLLTVRSIYS